MAGMRLYLSPQHSILPCVLLQQTETSFNESTAVANLKTYNILEVLLTFYITM